MKKSQVIELSVYFSIILSKTSNGEIISNMSQIWRRIFPVVSSNASYKNKIIMLQIPMTAKDFLFINLPRVINEKANQ